MSDEVNKFVNRVPDDDDDKGEIKPAMFIGAQLNEYALWI
jgi:hypothetical protein